MGVSLQRSTTGNCVDGLVLGSITLASPHAHALTVLLFLFVRLLLPRLQHHAPTCLLISSASASNSTATGAATTTIKYVASEDDGAAITTRAFVG
mmetsp:Transcript_24892/g.65649  ORF Transcript_24892/g.65649 Transcript_24892/m.65649 type:complete len:95 (+) Transcript_24892:69-353(+)